MTRSDDPGNEPGGPRPASLLHVCAIDLPLPDPHAKSTSPTGQAESSLSIWNAHPATSAGVWECEPGEFTSAREGYSEICQVLSGSGSVHGEDGTSADLKAGSLLVLPAGWRGTWTIREKIRKTYVLFPG
ncbi:cupin domain-containing protein [Arthrobacter oryzae]|uniref:(S)-ureidoglycine aminohydrolase cupin domain-containing protein n=1 Tax=Arthrobacter oryzae TaxID=409290 RepID=A0A495ETI9_9MICC|nr:cupin domain-containing protein [Arthrobacter oryzae]RKR20102.1 hypothetical protein C8D78_1914 [Arthrobacter oryzae]